MTNVDQHLNVQLRMPSIIADPRWSKNQFKAPIPTRHQVWDLVLENATGIRVISTVEFTSPARGVEWHLSISYTTGLFSISPQTHFPPRWIVRKVRRDFCVEDFEQDDHGSTVAHLWLPVERDKRGDCDCK